MTATHLMYQKASEDHAVVAGPLTPLEAGLLPRILDSIPGNPFPIRWGSVVGVEAAEASHAMECFLLTPSEFLTEAFLADPEFVKHYDFATLSIEPAKDGTFIASVEFTRTASMFVTDDKGEQMLADRCGI